MSNDLELKVRERLEFLKLITEFADKACREQGVCVKNEERSAHTHIVRELKEFGGFTFVVEYGKTMYGGNEVTVVQHYEHAGAETVLRVTWQTDLGKEGVVEKYGGHHPQASGWEKRLLGVVDNYGQIVRDIEAGKQRETEAAARMSESAKKRAALEETARRLQVL